MKVLVGYDGSDCAEAALEDLARAGLPAHTKLLVLSVADVLLPPRGNADEEKNAPVPESVRAAWAEAERSLDEARNLAARAATRIKGDFPAWDVAAEATADSPAWAILKQADAWGPDLVVVGTHGHGLAGGRFILGSVSQRVLYEARCSVRVARRAESRRTGPVRIALAYDGSSGATHAGRAIASRAWPEGSSALVVTALEAAEPADPEIAALMLRSAGLTAATVIKEGNPAHMILGEAESWHADVLFAGARGVRGVERLLLGSTSLTLSARAHCSVEIVR
jgi:nucleotide-binding universal stress UspA family protein